MTPYLLAKAEAELSNEEFDELMDQIEQDRIYYAQCREEQEFNAFLETL